ncbi:uncharacterized protein LOC141708403 [Apium graveolens]|uniref:uncharacterized protein LOC141708403 n=1 Tax=Apium graveolens TaxID=4045 RepID=UPI003D78C89A
MDIPTDCSWIWRQVLKLRGMALWFITYHIVSGISISLWFEPWWNSCCLVNSVTAPIISQCFLPANATVACVINSGIWSLLRPNSRIHHTDYLLTSWLEDPNLPPIHSSGRDHILWDGLDASKIKTWHIWSSIRNTSPLVPWHKVVWHRLQVNRYAHHRWLTCLDQISTLARLHRFDLSSTQQYFFCILDRETTSHLCLHCTYSKWILMQIFRVFDIPVSYHSLVEFLVSLSELEDKQKGTIALSYARVFCYHIWRERNARAHDKGVFGPSKLLQGIVLNVKARLSASGWYSSVICNRPPDLDIFVRL